MMTKRLCAIISIFLAVAAIGIPAQEKAAAQETSSSVPELEAFHEIIYPIWHTAYPEKNIAALKSYVPRINELAAKIYTAKLPGILREKNAVWTAGVDKLKQAVDAYNTAAKGTDHAA